MSDYTKGPWKVEEIEDNGGAFLVNCVTPRMSGGAATNGNSWVGTVWTPKTGKKYSAGHRTRTLHDYREAEANARLISAAPDMYEALKLALPQSNDQATVNVIKAVLLKAEGKD